MDRIKMMRRRLILVALTGLTMVRGLVTPVAAVQPEKIMKNKLGHSL